MDSTASKPNLQPIPSSVGEIKYQETSVDIWEGKYCLKTKRGEMVDKSMDDTFARVAKALAEVEEPDVREHWRKEFLLSLIHI